MEMTSLAIMSILFLLAFIPVSAGKLEAYGFKWLASNRHSLPGKELPIWGQRCERAHNNLKDNFPAFVAAILGLVVLNKTSQATSIAAMVYVVARIVHYASYGLGNVNFRFLSYVTGLVANIFLLVKIIL